MSTATCRSCGAEVTWVVTTNGKKMPVDAEPDPEGKFLLNDDDPPLATYVHDDQRDGVDVNALYQSHFATCPSAAMHRR